MIFSKVMETTELEAVFSTITINNILQKLDLWSLKGVYLWSLKGMYFEKKNELKFPGKIHLTLETNLRDHLTRRCNF